MRPCRNWARTTLGRLISPPPSPCGTTIDPARGAGVREYPSGVTAAYLQRDREAVALLWNTRRAKTTALGLSGLPSGTRLLDTMGNPLPARIAGGRVALAVDRHPVYVIAPGLRAEALATLVARSR